MSDKKPYIILSSFSHTDLETEVNEKKKEGYTPHGSLVAVVKEERVKSFGTQNKIKYLQPMELKETTK